MGRDRPVTDEPSFSAWSFLRRVLERGAAIQQDYIAGNHASYEAYSARVDAVARELADELKVELVSREANLSAYLERGVRGTGGVLDMYPDWVYEARRAIEHRDQNVPWLPELLRALGWEGGTVHQTINAVWRLVEADKQRNV